MSQIPFVSQLGDALDIVISERVTCTAEHRTGLRLPDGGRRKPRPAARIAVLVLAVAAAVFVIANVSSTGSGSAVSSAQARAILRHVRAALVLPPHAIYEEEQVSTVTARGGAKSTSGYHEWLSTSPPYNDRSIQMENGKVQWEQAFVGARLDLYVPATNTVYLQPEVPARYRSQITQVTANPDWNSALAEVQSLLNQPNVTTDLHAMLDGKPAIELTFDNGRFSYWISPSTYQPLQSEDRQAALPDGQPGVRITRYPIARLLTGQAASLSLLSLEAQHPGAAIDRSTADYRAALRLLHLSRPPFVGAHGIPSADRKSDTRQQAPRRLSARVSAGRGRPQALAPVAGRP